LEKKLIPNEQEMVRVVIGKPEPAAEVGVDAPFLIDKRKQGNINRDQILQRLCDNQALLCMVKGPGKRVVKEDVGVKDDSTTIKKGKKRLVIRPGPAIVIKTPGYTEQKEGEGLDVDIDEGKGGLDVVEDEGKGGLDVVEEEDKDQDVEVDQDVDEDVVEDEDVAIERVIEENVAILTDEPKGAKGTKGTKGKAKAKGKAKGKKEAIDEDVDLTTAVIRTQNVADRLPAEREKIKVTPPSLYMNNRKLFVQNLMTMFHEQTKELLKNTDTVSCAAQRQTTEFDLLSHQRIVRDYLNTYTPYRGLLLYHGLGSGKTCTSIALAEGMKSNRQVYVLTPASLKMNFFSEMKKCGDPLYKKTQFWEFISTEGNPEYVPILAKALSLSTEYIRRNRGAWLINVRRGPNFVDLSTEEQDQVDEQLNAMIRSKYIDLNYNGLNRRIVDGLTEGNTKNPFDNAVVIIDEAHNFVSRIVNKIKKKDSIAYILYDCLMRASNAKVVLLTGTPIINYPNEIGVLFNILRGYIKVWTMTLNPKTADKVNTETILSIFNEANFKSYDLVEYTGSTLTITRNPFGFINSKKKGRAAGVRGGSASTKKKNTSLKNRIQSSKKGKRTLNKKTINKKTLNKMAEKHTLTGDQPKKRITISHDDNEDPPFVNVILGLEDENQVANKITYDPPYIPEDERFENIPPQPMYVGGGVFEQYNGVRLDETGNISDMEFISTVVRLLKNKNIDIPEASIKLGLYSCLPDDADAFMSTFVNKETGDAKNINLFQRRILGLTSYFRSAQEQLLPSFVKTETGDNYHVVASEMSDHQYVIYSKIRQEEADREKSAKKKKGQAGNKGNDDLYNISSTYRIFSRAACNFVFPEGIERPVPPPRIFNTKGGVSGEGEEEINENIFDAVTAEQLQEEDPYAPMDVLTEGISGNTFLNPTSLIATPEENMSYLRQIEAALAEVAQVAEGTNDPVYLNEDSLRVLSPKFLAILENLKDEANVGLHLLYSHFRTIEGIGIMRLILLANGFVEFKLKRTGSTWDLDQGLDEEMDAGKPRFVLYTGTETVEEKEIIRNVYNGAWEFVPANIVSKLQEIAPNNNMGEIIKLMMITSSGAEGINLRNTRFVHIVEPYWHMVRVEQVVGRARRICSHQDLPEELRTVQVFLYLTVLSERQKTDDSNIELRIRDISRVDRKTPVTTDETLYEIASLKQRINNQILRAIKETAIDCNVYSLVNSSKGKSGKEEEEEDDDPSAKNSSEPLVCYGFGKVESNQFSSYPSFEEDRKREAQGLDEKTVSWRAIKITFGGVDYALNEDTMEVYDFESYHRAAKSGIEPVLIGKLVRDKSGQYRII